MKKIVTMIFLLMTAFLVTPFFSLCTFNRAVLSADDKEFGKQNKNDRWVVTWASAQQLTEPHNLPPSPGLENKTLRQVIHVSIGGKWVRFKFSNVFGRTPVIMSSVHVALSTGGNSINMTSDKALTFQGKYSVTIPPKEDIYSDPLEFNLESMSDLVVSIYFSEISAQNVTGHPGSRCTSYIQDGEAVLVKDMEMPVKVTHWYVLAGLEVWSTSSGATLVIVGDSITDGRGSTTDNNDRWPDALARRMHNNKITANIGIYNAGIGGNCLVRGGLGPPLIQRLERDVLTQKGVRWVIVFEGVNDIGSARQGNRAEEVKKDLIAAYEKIINQAHESSIRVYGATITPFGGSFYYSSETEAVRQAVNEWIRNSGKFDAVIDMDKVTRNPEKPTHLKQTADCGDHLHLNPTGYQMLADAVDLTLFSR
jgi:lysophospholipase L1-like esterase